MAAFLAPLIVVMLIPTLLTELMAWKTRDIEEEYAESRWIFIMILVQFEVIIFAVPMIVLLRDVSTDARYIGYVFLIWTFPMSAIVLIIGPKVLAFLGMKRPVARRGTTLGEVHVSGLSQEANAGRECPGQSNLHATRQSHSSIPNCSGHSHSRFAQADK